MKLRPGARFGPQVLYESYLSSYFVGVTNADVLALGLRGWQIRRLHSSALEHDVVIDTFGTPLRLTCQPTEIASQRILLRVFLTLHHPNKLGVCSTNSMLAPLFRQAYRHTKRNINLQRTKGIQTGRTPGVLVVGQDVQYRPFQPFPDVFRDIDGPKRGWLIFPQLRTGL